MTIRTFGRRFPLMDQAPAAPGGGNAPAASAAPATPAVAAPAATPAAPAAPAAPPPGSPWYTSIQDQPMRDWAQTKGWTDPLAAVESAYNAEKLIGLDRAGRTVVLPRDATDVEGTKAFRQKIGVPDSPEGYVLEQPGQQSVDPDFSKAAQGWMHKAGLTPDQAKVLVESQREFFTARGTANVERYTKEAQTSVDAVLAEWGQAAAERNELAERAIEKFLPAEVTLDNGQKMGQKDFMGALRAGGFAGAFLKMFADIGAGFKEAPMINGSAATTGNLTPAEARNKMAELKADPAWVTKYLAKDPAANAEMQRLLQAANPPQDGAIDPLRPETYGNRGQR